MFSYSSGFVLSKGKFTGKNIFYTLLQLSSGYDYKLAYKLTEKHLTVEGKGRMTVNVAA